MAASPDFSLKSWGPEPMRCCRSVSIAIKETNLPPPSAKEISHNSNSHWKWKRWLSPLVWLTLQHWRLKLDCLQKGNSCSCQVSLCERLWLDSLENCGFSALAFQSLGMTTRSLHPGTLRFDLKLILILHWWKKSFSNLMVTLRLLNWKETTWEKLWIFGQSKVSSLEKCFIKIFFFWLLMWGSAAHWWLQGLVAHSVHESQVKSSERDIGKEKSEEQDSKTYTHPYSLGP